MPMRAQMYPVGWKLLAYEIKDANGWICHECGVQCRRPGDAYDHTQPELTVSHYFNDYRSAEIFVAPMCAGCHLTHDKPFHWMIRRRNEDKRRRAAGQKQFELPLTLF